ncbi:MAG: hypothetical protein MMC33_007210 [Icmadophila ericetorum]|nr:hypothetical protein [Icmadophila ericetorum]
MTRRLIAEGQRPVTVGTYFTATASAISKKFNSFSKIGGIIGTSVSASFLIILGLLNGYIFYKLWCEMQRMIRAGDQERKEFKIEGKGPIFWILKKLFKLIDRPWKMYPLGVMFGLGFDTSSEVALLGIASIQGTKGTSIWVILIFPILFTAGMMLLDTLDGALMLTLYTSSAYASDSLAILYYSLVLTFITIIVALVIGIIQLLSLVLNVANPPGKFWEGVAIAGDNFDIIGTSRSSL